MKKLQESLEMKYDAKMELIRGEILSIVTQDRASSASSQIAELASLKTKLDIMQKEHLNCIKQADIIRSLYLPVLRRRWNLIPQADRTSNAWVFDTSATSFRLWLESGPHADGLYCITGRVCFHFAHPFESNVLIYT
jgi:hypothetical protein